MKISVIGCGYLGAVHAAAMASLGHDVVGIDVDPDRVETLSQGRAPFFEPGLQDLLDAERDRGRLTFTTDLAAARGAVVHFVAVGTPQRSHDFGADLTFVDAAVGDLLPHLSDGDLVVGKSTVPVGTAARLAELVARQGAELAWNPEFLREGHAVMDTIEPDRLVYGVTSQRAVEILDEVYAHALGLDTPRIVTDYATAELVKTAANAFLATKISFINAMAEISEVVGADVTQLADAIGHDARIGRRFLNAGLGFGGGCLPKDIRAFQARADELGLGQSLAFLREIDAINLRRRQRVVELAESLHGGSVFQRRIAVLGLAFKPESDDVRDSPALDIAVQLHGRGAAVRAYDPEAVPNARRRHPQLSYGSSLEDTVAGAECVVLSTEWRQFTDLDPTTVAGLVETPVVIDGRNALDPVRWREAGWTYHGLGRP